MSDSTANPEPKSVTEWAAMRSARVSPVASVPLVPAPEPIAASPEPVEAPKVEAAPTDKPAPAETVAAPDADPLANLPPEAAEKLRRREAATVGEITKERNRRRAAEDAVVAEKAAREADKVRLDKLADAVERLIPKEGAAPRPQRTEFDNPNTYEEALLDWHGKQMAVDADKKAAEAVRVAETNRTQQERLKAQEAAEQSQAQLWHERRAAFIETTPDFDAVVAVDPSEGGPAITGPMRDAILAVENSAEVAYQLGKNVQESYRIAGLNPIGQAVEIARISARLDAAKQAAAQAEAVAKISRAAPVMKPLGGVQSANEKTPHDMSMAEYAAQRLPQLRAERTNGHLRN